MYLAKSLYQQFVATIYMLQSTYALFFAVVGFDRLMHFSNISWESYLSALLVQSMPVEGTVIVTTLAIVQLAAAAMLMMPYMSRWGAYLGFLLLLFVAADLVVANGGEFYSRAALHAVAAVGVLALIQLQSVHAGLRS